MNKPSDSGNLILAMLLSAAVYLGWMYLFEGPRLERQRLAQQAAQQTTTQTDHLAAPTAPGGATPLPGAAATPQPRETVLANGGPRLHFENDKVDGTINLTGARLDDLQLKQYRETTDPKSPEIVLLTPQGTTGATYTEVGWTPAPGSATRVPDTTTNWTASGTKLTPGSPVTLTWDNGQGLVFKRLVALDDNYMFTVTDTVENTSGAPVTLYPYALVAREGEPKTASSTLQHEGPFGELDEGLKEETYKDLRELETKEIKFPSKNGWLGITDKYWMATVAPARAESFTGRFSVSGVGGPETYRSDYLLGPRNIAAGQTATVSHYVFAGAKLVSLLETYRDKLSIYRFDRAVDWGWFSPVSYPIFVLLDWLYKQVGNFGVAIILLTLIVKTLFFPLANRSYESMTKMKKIQPQIKELQERYKDDRMKQQQEQMALFKREHVNPMMGCLPLLIQIPVFFALYKVLYVSIQMRHAPFFGWIHDLAAADPTSLFNLFGLLPFALPSFLHIGAWPLVMGATMWFQTKLNPPATDPVQQQMMSLMPLIFTVMMAQFPAGLVVYWTVNNLLSIGQQYIIMRRMNVPIEFVKSLPAPIARLLKRPRSDAAPGE